MSMTRNQRRKYADFMKDAGIQNFEDLQMANVIQVPPQPEPVIVQSRPKKIKEVDVVQMRMIASQPKKVRRIQKNANKEKQLKHRCDKIVQLQKSAPICLASPFPDCQQFLVKDKQMSQEANASKSTSLAEEQKKTSSSVSKVIVRGYLYPSCINKSYNKFYGYFGHCSIFTKRPIIQGRYYIEIKILPHTRLVDTVKRQIGVILKDSHPEYEPAVRIGLAKLNHKLLVPLGGEESYCLQCRTGNILYNKQVIGKVSHEQTVVGDVIGVELYMSPPIPHEKNGRSPPRINDESVLVFSRNGIEIGRVEGIQQGFYVFGASLYNWANIQFNEGPEFQYGPADQQARAYQAIYSEQYLYKDLKFD